LFHILHRDILSDVNLTGLYNGRACFAVSSGPSFNKLDKSLLSLPGICTFGVNNSPKVFRPNFQVSMDEPARFLESVWLDPRIMKFVNGAGKRKHPINHTLTKAGWQDSNITIKDCPACIYFDGNTTFNAKEFFHEDSVNWGNSAQNGGGRSVNMALIKIAYVLGFRRLYLTGVDFTMSSTNTYSFSEQRAQGAVKNNNSTYMRMISYFTQLVPEMEKVGFKIYQCSPGSDLTLFPYMPFEEAIQREIQGMPDPEQEETWGRYVPSDANGIPEDIKQKLLVRPPTPKMTLWRAPRGALQEPVSTLVPAWTPQDQVDWFAPRKDAGVLYFNSGHKLICRLLVSLDSLRQRYTGEVSLLASHMPDDVLKVIADSGVNVIRQDLKAGGQEALLVKTRLDEFTPFKRTLFLDADTLVLGDVRPMFSQLDEYECIFTQFSAWMANHRAIEHRVRIIMEKGHITKEQYLEAISPKRPAINIGVYSWREDATIWKEWKALSHKITDHYIPDEASLQAVLHKHNHKVESNNYNVSLNRPGYLGPTPDTSKWVVLHLAGRAHTSSKKSAGWNKLWIEHAKKMYKEDRMNFKKILDTYFYKNELEMVKGVSSAV